MTLPFLITSLIVVFGWPIVSALAADRDREAKRRDSRVKTLEQCFLGFLLAGNRTMTTEQKASLERFIGEIQLYGTPEQVKLVGDVVTGFTTPGTTVSFDPLLVSLRDLLRIELKLEPVTGPVWWLRLN